jgi:hypothetical protein
MSDKLEIDIDATSLSNSACMRKFYLTVIGSIEDGKIVGGYRTLMDATAVYGIAVHKFIDMMYKSGDFIVARDAANKAFNMKKAPAADKYKHLEDFKHCLAVCYNTWEEYVKKEATFDLLTIPTKCWACGGDNMTCTICLGEGAIDGPSTELTFRIKFYEDEHVIIYLCGTIDSIGKFKNGIFAIRDWKTTSNWKWEEYLANYKMSRQLRVYTLAMKLMARQFPDSTLGKIGATQFGAFIDGVFLKSKVNEIEFHRSEVFRFDDDDLNMFEVMLSRFCYNLSNEIQCNKIGTKEGILNGSCTAFFNHCQFWPVCSNNETVGKVLLERNFTRKIYNPLKFGE